MPNHLVFNNVANELRTLIYGRDDTGTNRIIRTDEDGNLQFTSTDTLQTRYLSGATDSITVSDIVEISATDIDIRELSGATDSITVSDIVEISATDIDIRELSGATDSITVSDIVEISATDIDIRQLSGDTDSVTVSDIVEISATDIDIRELSGDTDSITISGKGFTESYTQLVDVTDSGSVMEVDTSEQDTYTFYVRNLETSTGTLVVGLEISPTTTDDFFVLDEATGTFTLQPGSVGVLVPSTYMKYTRVFYDALEGDTSSADVFYNAHI
ncbi:hypothetical protein EDC19_1046 [Natranaerovirga hydrolytica]|uniref:DUF6385 domain-containing protein n=1 Tax=Natranaerovirga hydrolytica TaxID=680378 RepID=A0A4R1N3I5_9FIRM|nr:DUF6385 domain-containing protein [Natranaerovirga hydrolytica]TCK98614.1 hypothetical protein EDC19_1046 [Natranaerovirga hydrolytica]